MAKEARQQEEDGIANMKDNRTIEQMWREMTAPQPVEEALNMQVKRVADQLKTLMDKEKNVQKKMKMADEIMQNILGEEYGAGEWGTDKLRKTYAKDTPGQMPNAELAVDGVPTVGGQITKPDPFKGASAVQKPKGVSLAEDPAQEQKEVKTELDEMTRDERLAAIKAAHQRVMQKEKEAEARAKRDAKRGMKSPGATKGMADVKMEAKKLDPVGKADADIDNDGDVDKSDSYLHNRRKAIKKAMKEALRVKDTSGSLGDLKKAKQGASLSAKSIAQDTRKAAASDIKDIRKKTMGNPAARKQAMAKADYAVKKEEVANEAIQRKADSKMIMAKDPNTGRTVLKTAPRKSIEIGKGKMESVETVDEVTYVPGFVGADGKATSKPTAKDYAANKEYQAMKKKLGDRIPGPKPTKEGVMDAVKSKFGKLKKSVSDFHKTDLAAQIRKNKTTKTMEDVQLGEEGGKIPKYATHVGDTKHGHSVYADSETDRGDASYYHVKHPDGKVTHHEIEHEDSVPSHKELATKSHWHNTHDLHKSVHKIMRNDIKDGLGHYGEETQYTDKEIRMAKGIAFDPRHKGGDYTGAAKKMEKIKKGLSDHPKVKNALRAANESFEKGTPTGVKIYHRDKKTGKEHWSIHFTARDAQRHVDQMKKAGHTETKRSLMYGDKEGKPRMMSK